ncbi:MAG: translocation/assembly module TamB domain-containing protein [Defluviimonas sp.]|nr:translocation/assembly module TamB domain-containing protein [Defluviimonas sp.]
MIRWLLSLAICLFLPMAAAAQDDAQSEADRGWLTSFLEDSLSGAGREVRIEGFEGAFSSRATFTRMSLADDEGIWLTISDGAIQWNRSALLAGRIEISELTAAEIDLPRLPGSAGGGTDLPKPEASGFALPDLPVSVRIDTLRADRVIIGEPVFGADATVSLDGSGQLADGEGSVDLTVTRIDGAQGELSLSGAYANESRQVMLDLLLNEGSDGIAATLLGIPGTPALTLAVAGTGPLDDFGADVVLTTDGQPRLSGRVEVLAQVPQGQTEPLRSFRVDLGGDVAPLFLPAYRDFFGPEIRLVAAGARQPSGAVSLSDLSLRARGIDLRGQLELGADGLPVLADLSARLGLEDGGEMLLPGAGTPTRLRAAVLTLGFDAAEGPDWRLAGEVMGLRQGDLGIARLRLDGAGQIARPTGAGAAAVTAAFDFAATGITAADAALAQAIGPRLTGRARLDWQSGGALNISELVAEGADYGLNAEAEVTGFDTAFTIDGTARARLDDLTRFSGLAGRPLSGAAEAEVAGSYGLLSGVFDLTAEVAGMDLTAGIAELDALLAGRSQIAASIRRDETGTELRSLTLRASSLAADASGQLATGASDLTATLNFADLSVMGGPYRGSLSVEAGLKQAGPLSRFTVSGTGSDLAIGIPQADGLLAGDTTLTFIGGLLDGAVTLDIARIGNAQIVLDAAGRYQAGASDLRASVDLPDLSALGGGYRGRLAAEAHLTEDGPVRRLELTGTGNGLAIGQAQADRVLAGETSLDLAAEMEAGEIRVERFNLDNPQLTARATAQAEGASRSVDLEARLADLALVVPGFPGPLTVSGRAEDLGGSYRLDLTAQGPGSTDARVTGTVASDFATADLVIEGSAQAGLANPFLAPQSVEGPLSFDLRLNGAPGLGALSGRVSTTGARFSAPTAGIALEQIAASAELSGGRAQLSLNARASEGGRIEVTGPVSLSAPYEGDLTARFDNTRLRDPELYDTRVNGGLTIRGPLAGGATIAGRLELTETEIRVPSTGFGGATAIPDLEHVAEPAPVRATRARAGLIGTERAGSGGSARPYGLDLRVIALNQIFVRGRGLDAELGGQVRLLGTTADVQPQGRFELIRGRLDILGQRFTLDEGLVELQGSMEPYIRFSASTETDGDTATIMISGPAYEPEIDFLSSSGLPEEEVLARLLFGRGLDNISPLQAAQLASAVATLSGRGGQGIVGRLRQNFGLDDFDLSTGADGNAALRAGKYLSENLYTDVTVGAAGNSSISLNLDVTKNIVIRGAVDAEGGSGAGVFFQKDY